MSSGRSAASLPENKRRPLRSALLAATLAALVAQPAASGRAVDPAIAPPQSKPYGLTYGEWSARWWKWALEVPAANSPLLDPTGINCAEGQTRMVWFLAGTLDPGDPVVRTCTVPVGTSLFFPIGNGFCVAEGDGSFEFQQQCAAAFFESITSLEAEVDGDSIEDLSRYRAQSPAFDLVLPSGNVFNAPAGVYSPTAADGVYLMLRPLSKGEHTLHIRAEFGGNAIDVTYFLTVG
jgi:hypothetical protein